MRLWAGWAADEANEADEAADNVTLALADWPADLTGKPTKKKEEDEEKQTRYYNMGCSCSRRK